MITKGKLLQLANESYKLSVCRKCGHYPQRVGKEEGLCRRCKIQAAPVVEGLLLGYHFPVDTGGI